MYKRKYRFKFVYCNGSMDYNFSIEYLKIIVGTNYTVYSSLLSTKNIAPINYSFTIIVIVR
jgi:hypothetical protein